MVKVKNDLTGKRFGKLVVIKQTDDYVSPKGERRSRWLCKCDCGNETIVLGRYLMRGTQSCGCLTKESVSKRNRKHNTFDLNGKYGVGYTTKGEEFWFDLEDYNKIKNYCWHITDKGYVSTHAGKKQLFLHKLVMNTNNTVDHIKHNTFDNRKSNLRIATKQQNAQNASLSKNNTSGVTGVTWHKRDKVWQARITLNYKKIHLGYFESFDDAVRARKEAEEKYYGKYSYDNSMKDEVA